MITSAQHGFTVSSAHFDPTGTTPIDCEAIVNAFSGIDDGATYRIAAITNYDRMKLSVYGLMCGLLSGGCVAWSSMIL